MAQVKLTKNELRVQQNRLLQLQRYLPTLQLKKALLQSELHEARAEIVQYELEFTEQQLKVENISELLSQPEAEAFKPALEVATIERRFENIAGLEVSYLDAVKFQPYSYSLLDTPAWVDGAIAFLQGLVQANIRVKVGLEKKAALERELREVSIRVNLFEKVLIPCAAEQIKRIRIYLGDQQLAAVSQAKVAKSKIEQRRSLRYA